MILLLPYEILLLPSCVLFVRQSLRVNTTGDLSLRLITCSRTSTFECGVCVLVAGTSPCDKSLRLVIVFTDRLIPTNATNGTNAT